MRKLLTGLCLATSCLVSYGEAEAAEKIERNSQLSVSDIYLTLLKGSRSLSAQELKRIDDDWQLADTPMILESMNFMRQPEMLNLLHGLLRKKSGKDFALGSDEWRQWLWSQKYQDHPDYASFKSSLYRAIDPKFEAYFDDNPQSTIRLDEIRWGGVVQDGIPPLRNPKMISAKKANYLADSDVVFGIEVNGDFRAYPNRILAWHEMFTDTIQGVPLAGVY